MYTWSISLLMMLLFCTGCANEQIVMEESPIQVMEDAPDPAPVATVQSSPVAVAAQTEPVLLADRDLLEAVTLPIATLNQCYVEKFTTVAAHEQYLMAGYTDATHFETDFQNPAILFSPDNRDTYAAEYYLDPSEAAYERIMNYSTVAEVRAYLNQYLTDAVIDTFPFAEDFFEYEGSLYLVRGARGYGAYELVEDSARVLTKTADTAQVQVDLLYFGEVVGEVDMDFTLENGIWRIQSTTEREFDT